MNYLNTEFNNLLLGLTQGKRMNYADLSINEAPIRSARESLPVVGTLVAVENVSSYTGSRDFDSSVGAGAASYRAHAEGS
jgi:hypothetical protein